MSTVNATNHRDAARLAQWERVADALEAVGHLTDVIHAVRQQSRQHAEDARVIREAAAAGTLPGFMGPDAADTIAAHHEREADGLEAIADLLDPLDPLDD